MEQAIEYARIALRMHQSHAEAFPADTHARHKLAGAYLALAHLYGLMAAKAEDDAVRAQYRQEACDLYQRAKPILGNVPDVGLDRLRDRDGLQRLREACAS